jgi:ferric-dicitrate binding protein FerR (iron transport regulator)
LKSKHNIQINDELIARYLVGEAAPDEAIAFDDWLADPANRSHFEAIKEVWQATHPHKQFRQVSGNNAWSKINLEINAGSLSKKTKPFISPGRFALRIAATLALFITAGLVVYYSWNPGPEDISASSSASLRSVDFPDHSTAILYLNSEIKYPASFEGRQREVRLLKGEAFFTITPDKEKPFVIHTSVAEIKVLGTSFNVSVNNDRIEVGVYEGKVMVASAYDTSYLEAGSTGIVQAGESAIRIRSAVNANAWGYATRRFIFKDTPLKEVIASLEKAYPNTIRVRNENINNCNLTVTFDNVSAEKMVDLIAETLNLSVTKNGPMFILEGEGCP